MKKSDAVKLIEKHRQLWRSQESDAVITRRAEQTYLSVGLLFVVIALIDFALSEKLTTYRISFAVIIFSLGTLFCWQSYRFRRACRLLSDSKTYSGTRR
jgi:hypothetical protein